MTDTVSCENCGATLPADAVFCTSCGTKVQDVPAGAESPASPAEPAAPGSPAEPPEPAPPSEPAAVVDDDATRVVSPGFQDTTQLLPGARTPVDEGQDETRVIAPAPPAWSPPEPPAGAPPSPWQPPDPAAAPSPPAAPGAWQPPPPPQPDWAQQPPAGGQGWAPPAAPSAPPSSWQAQPPPAQWPAAGASPVTAAGAPGAKRKGAGLVAVLAFVGAIALIVAVFTLWLQSAKSSGVKLTGWEMVTKKDKAGPLKSPDPAILLGIAAAALAVGGLVLAGVNRTLMRVLLAAAGIGAAVVFVRDYLSIKDTVKKAFNSGVTIDFKYGFWLVAAGAIVLIVAAIVPSRDSR